MTPFKITISRQLFFVKQRTFSLISFFLLDNKVSGKARAVLLSAMGAKIGKNCFLRGGLNILETINLTLGNTVFINNNCTIDCSAPVTIGDNVCLSYHVTIMTGSHEIGPHSRRTGEHKNGAVTIGDGAWIGARAIIMPGVTIGAGSVVGAGSLITKSIPPDVVAYGVPARVMSELDDAETSPYPEHTA